MKISIKKWEPHVRELGQFITRRRIYRLSTDEFATDLGTQRKSAKQATRILVYSISRIERSVVGGESR